MSRFDSKRSKSADSPALEWALFLAGALLASHLPERPRPEALWVHVGLLGITCACAGGAAYYWLRMFLRRRRGSGRVKAALLVMGLFTLLFGLGDATRSMNKLSDARGWPWSGTLVWAGTGPGANVLALRDEHGRMLWVTVDPVAPLPPDGARLEFVGGPDGQRELRLWPDGPAIGEVAVIREE